VSDAVRSEQRATSIWITSPQPNNVVSISDYSASKEILTNRRAKEMDGQVCFHDMCGSSNFIVRVQNVLANKMDLESSQLKVKRKLENPVVL
jgi:hypothetical protein